MATARASNGSAARIGFRLWTWGDAGDVGDAASSDASDGPRSKPPIEAPSSAPVTADAATERRNS